METRRFRLSASLLGRQSRLTAVHRDIWSHTLNRRSLILAGILCAITPASASAHGYRKGNILIDHPWTRPTARGQNAAGYMVIGNTGRVSDRLISVECALASRVTLHSSEMRGGVMSMRQLNAVAVEPGGTIRFAPGGLHIMFEGLQAQFAIGSRVTANLVFRRAGRIAVQFTVQSAAPAATPAMPDMPGMQH